MSFGTLKEKKYASYPISIMAATTVTYFFLVTYTSHKKLGIFDFEVKFMENVKTLYYSDIIS